MTTSTDAPPSSAANAAAPAVQNSSRKFPIAPYAMVAPMLLVFAGVLGFPFIRLIIISFQNYGKAQILPSKSTGVPEPATWVGFANYIGVFQDPQFYRSLMITVQFVVAAVGFTMIFGLLIAQLITKVSGWVRVVMLTSMIAVWALPPIIAMPLWQWLTDKTFGALNYVLWKLSEFTRLGFFPKRNLNWFSDPLTGWALITIIVVWGALPFVVISLHAAMTAVSQEHVEAARLDGAGAWRLFTTVTFPAIKPTLLILIVLSIIWDYRVFAQVWLFRKQGATGPDYQTVSIWSYFESFSKNDFGYGAAIAIVSVMLLGTMSAFAVKHVLTSTKANERDA